MSVILRQSECNLAARGQVGGQRLSDVKATTRQLTLFALDAAKSTQARYRSAAA
jgi:hypothetical protein